MWGSVRRTAVVSDSWPAAPALSLTPSRVADFSAHWCPPCRGFTPQLAEWYTEHAASLNMEIVFASTDNNEAEFDEYFGEMPWVAFGTFSTLFLRASFGRKPGRVGTRRRIRAKKRIFGAKMGEKRPRTFFVPLGLACGLRSG